MSEVNHNPDVLTCLANLSNDEVFTPPEVANAVLDMLPSDLWSNPNTKILDPATKSGIFLREAAKRLIDGLADKIPDLQERIDHVMHKQLYGYAITELTAHLSRRSLYCSKTANGPYSITQFKTDHGNILFHRVNHKWADEKCIYCGASKDVMDRGEDMETHAYEFIHMTDKTAKELTDMKFDLIIGNPPYQLNTAGTDNGAQAKPIYHMFVEQAMKLKPRYLCMITPSRWFAGGWGLDDFRNTMMSQNHISTIHDFLSSSSCFSGVEIKGGVSYFLWERDFNGMCQFISHSENGDITTSKRFLSEPGCEIIIRSNELISIYHKVRSCGQFIPFSSIVSGRSPYGLNTNHYGNKEKKNSDDVIYFERGGNNYIERSRITRAQDTISKYKLFVAKTAEDGKLPGKVIGKVSDGTPGMICSGTYLLVGPFKDKEESDNTKSYMVTKFFRAMVAINKITQDAYAKVYDSVPMQDFSRPWTDAELYAKYKLTPEEIEFIESMIKPMDLASAPADGGCDE